MYCAIQNTLVFMLHILGKSLHLLLLHLSFNSRTNSLSTLQCPSAPITIHVKALIFTVTNALLAFGMTEPTGINKVWVFHAYNNNNINNNSPFLLIFESRLLD